MKKNNFYIITLLLLILFCMLPLSGCDKQYTVKFCDNRSYYISAAQDRFYEEYEIKVAKGSHINLPSNPKQWSSTTKFIFKGWYKDRECTEKWIENDDVVNTNLILYAKWEII